jgi:hypothetical protein
MIVWVLPVSGGYFPKQLAMCSLVSELCDPDIIVGSSGGNICSYIHMASNNSLSKMREISCGLKSSMFVENWWPDPLSFLPSAIIGAFRGSLYNHGNGGIEYLKSLFNRDSIQRTEIWTGTTNKGRAQLFCNRSIDSAIIQPWNVDLLNGNTNPLKYLEGDIHNIGQVCLGSACVPTLIPHVRFEDLELVDGGVTFASPLTPLQNGIIEVAEDNLHIVYISSFDLDSASLPGFNQNIIQVGVTTFDNMIKTLCFSDRLVAINMIKNNCNKIYEHNQFIGTISDAVRIQERSSRSLIEIYPSDNKNPVNLSNFNGKDVLDLFDYSRIHYRIRIWWSN